MKFAFEVLAFLAVSEAQYFGEYIVRLEKWNTGRLYFAEDNTFRVNNFGPVCCGTGDESITGDNGKAFARAVCERIGFGQSFVKEQAFVGSRSEYFQFMNLQNDDSGEECVPEYVLSGANCACHPGQRCTLEQCRLRNFYTDGGTCVRGQSDIYIHCPAPESNSVGSWSSWYEIKSLGDRCSPSDFFSQRYRTCKTVQEAGRQHPYCPGPWLQLVPCGLCETAIEESNTYNYENLNEYDYNYSYGNYDSSLRSGRLANFKSLKKTFRYPICKCVLTTVHVPVSFPVRRREGCDEVISIFNLIINQKSSKFNGQYVRTAYEHNGHAVWTYQNGKKTKAFLLWTRQILPHGYRRISGWVIVVKQRIRWVATDRKSKCPIDSWTILPRNVQRWYNIQ